LEGRVRDDNGTAEGSIVKNMLLHSREGSGERRSADINANLAYHGARAETSGFTITLQHLSSESSSTQT
jgi:two-component system, NtrC family, sensor kinase